MLGTPPLAIDRRPAPKEPCGVHYSSNQAKPCEEPEREPCEDAKRSHAERRSPSGEDAWRSHAKRRSPLGEDTWQSQAKKLKNSGEDPRTTAEAAPLEGSEAGPEEQ